MSVIQGPATTLFVSAMWRERLRAAVAKSGKKQSVIAMEAGVSPETLSRILTATHERPTFESVVQIAHAANETVGWLLDERGFSLSADEQHQLRQVVRFLDRTLLAAESTRGDRPEPNAVSATAEIPRVYTVRGARLVYEASGQSMLGAGIADRDLLFVKPTRGTREALGRVVVCRIDGAEYVKTLDTHAGRMRLLSHDERVPPIEVIDPETFELIGIVVGRSGALGG